MKRGRKILCLSCIVVIIYSFLFTPPIMIAKGAIILGSYTNTLDNPMVHLAEEDLNFPNRRLHYTTDFDYFYFLNFRFWEKLEIHQVEYVQQLKDAEVKQICPFVYSIEQKQKESNHITFGVKRGKKSWYFDYYVGVM